MRLIGEFKEFIVKGNALDLAVGVIIGAAFGGVVKSLVDDVMMPPVGALLGGVDFSKLAVTLRDPVPPGGTMMNGLTNSSAETIPAVVIGYGKFINALIALLIQGFAIFLLVKGINYLRRKPDPAPEVAPAPPEDVKLLTEIRDLLARS